jgi:hypothetical protein
MLFCSCPACGGKGCNHCGGNGSVWIVLHRMFTTRQAAVEYQAAMKSYCESVGASALLAELSDIEPTEMK